MTCHDTPCHGRQEHDTLRHATFPDTSRSDLRLVGYREMSRLEKFHEIIHFTQCKGKDIFQLRKSLKVG